jgi:hypothetical protein
VPAIWFFRAPQRKKVFSKYAAKLAWNDENILQMFSFNSRKRGCTHAHVPFIALTDIARRIQGECASCQQLTYSLLLVQTAKPSLNCGPQQGRA